MYCREVTMKVNANNTITVTRQCSLNTLQSVWNRLTFTKLFRPKNKCNMLPVGFVPTMQKMFQSLEHTEMRKYFLCLPIVSILSTIIMSRFFTVSFCLFFSYATGVCQGYTFFLSYRLHSEENNLDLGLILKLNDSSLCLDLPIVTLWFGKKRICFILQYKGF